jgi:hypothetical protein
MLQFTIVTVRAVVFIGMTPKMCTLSGETLVKMIFSRMTLPYDTEKNYTQ